MSRDSTKALDAITGHAASNGWRLETRGGENILLTRGRAKIAVRFDSHGYVISASVLGDRSLGGNRAKGKLDAVIEELNREP